MKPIQAREVREVHENEPCGFQRSGSPIALFRTDARDLSAEDFAKRHGSGFLLHTTADPNLPHGPAATQVGLTVEPSSPGTQEAPHADTTEPQTLVYAVVRSAESVVPLVTIGRTPNNDVVVNDLSVSRFHAFLKSDAERFRIQDASSRNGTAVNGATVPRQGEGEPVNLESGDSIRLGRVELTFLDAGALQQIALTVRS